MLELWKTISKRRNFIKIGTSTAMIKEHIHVFCSFLYNKNLQDNSVLPAQGTNYHMSNFKQFQRKYKNLHNKNTEFPKHSMYT